MLKLGQGVCPVRGPRIGSDDYDDDGIDTGTWVKLDNETVAFVPETNIELKDYSLF